MLLAIQGVQNRIPCITMIRVYELHYKLNVLRPQQMELWDDVLRISWYGIRE